jgi:cytoskeletal protein RodZ
VTEQTRTRSAFDANQKEYGGLVVNSHRSEKPVLFAKIWWLALALILLSVPLPWMAVLIANDRPPRKAETSQRLSPSRQAIAAPDEEPR